MFKGIFTILLLAIFSVNAYSQNNSSDSLLFHRYSDFQLPADAGFFIVKVAANTPRPVLNKLVLSSERRLQGNVFIVNKELNDELQAGGFLLRSEFANNAWKFSTAARRVAESKSKKNFRFVVQLNNEKALQTFIKDPSFSTGKKQLVTSGMIATFLSTFDSVETKLLTNKNITAIDIVENKPKEELAITGFDLSTNKLNWVHANYQSLLGEGQHISIKENDFDTADIDIKGRIDPSPLASDVITNHANFMATIIAGAGNSVYYAKGAAPAASVSSSSFENVMPDPDDYYLQNNITVQNHSYGTSIDNNYGLNAVAFDESAHKNESLIHVFSSGNSGLDTSKNGNYSNVPGFANITGNFKMAKNILVVGAVDSSGNVAPQSSAGPAFDGRIIPQLVAFQMNGTSESAALVSGTAALLQQFYKEKNHQDLPSALAKAILINSADDVNNPGPDFKTGFGNLDAMKAMDCINENKILSGTVSDGISQSFDLAVPAGISLLKITLAWNDTTASAFSPKALINDLDLQLTSATQNTVWKPWVLNTFPNADSLMKPAIRGRDSLNNVEQITLQNPVAGNYKINVKGSNILTRDQKFFIAYSLDSNFYFRWERPAGEDFAESGTSTILKWQTTFTGNGSLEYKFVSNNDWQKITDADLPKNNFNWQLPDTIARVLIRMKINNDYFYSDTFLISTLLKPTTGVNCGDSVLIYWNQLKSISRYQLYRLGKKYLEPFTIVSDTSAVILKTDLDNGYLAVAPILPDSSRGTKSFAFDYTLQGAGCYINSFYVNLDNNQAHLVLDLGTLNNVQSVSFEKLDAQNYETLSTTAIPEFENNFDVTSLKTGITFFRAKVLLNNGVILYSSIESVTYVEPGKYLLLPVPVRKNSAINLYTTIPDGEMITIADATGRVVLKKEIQFTHEYIQTFGFQAGLYFYRITKKGNKVSSGKLIVL